MADEPRVLSRLLSAHQDQPGEGRATSVHLMAGVNRVEAQCKAITELSLTTAGCFYKPRLQGPSANSTVLEEIRQKRFSKLKINIKQTNIYSMFNFLFI